MFVYFLHHIEGRRLKIGKANDIYQRLPGIGGIQAFNLASSLCLQMPCEEEAIRIEKLLHRLFNPWRLPVDDGNRYPGDTEQFDLGCFDRVVKFLSENSDLIGGAKPKPLPPMPLRIDSEETNGKALISEDVRQRREKARQEARRIQRERIDACHADTLSTLRKFADYVSRGEASCGIWVSPSEPNAQYLFVWVSGDDECRQFFWRELIQTYVISRTLNGSIFGGCAYIGGFGVHHYDASVLMTLESVLDERDAEASDGPSEARELVAKSIDAIRRIPMVDDGGVFDLLLESGLVEPIENMGIDGLKEKIRRVMLHKHSGEAFSGIQVGNLSVFKWVMMYCLVGLQRFGLTEDDIRLALDDLSSAAIMELSQMEREEDPMWGYYIYKQPLPSLY